MQFIESIKSFFDQFTPKPPTKEELENAKHNLRAQILDDLKNRHTFWYVAKSSERPNDRIFVFRNLLKDIEIVWYKDRVKDHTCVRRVTNSIYGPTEVPVDLLQESGAEEIFNTIIEKSKKTHEEMIKNNEDEEAVRILKKLV